MIKEKYIPLLLHSQMDGITTIGATHKLDASKINDKKIDIIEIENKIKDGTILFFDFDGTLIYTDYANYLAYKKAISTVLNKSISFKNNERFTRDKLKKTFPDLAKTQINEIIKKKELFYKEFLSETKPNKILCEVLNKFSKTNTTILVTNCQKDRALITLNYYNLEKKFSNIFYRQTNGTKRINKYQNAITKLNISLISILVFENEKSEFIDAMNAGIPTDNIICLNNK